MAVNNKSIDNMMLNKALEDIAEGMSYLSASNVYNISVNELKKQFLKKYMVHVKPTKTEVEECTISERELKPEQMEYFIRYISHTLLGTEKDIKDDFAKETQKWDLDSTQRKTLWKNLRTQTESSMQKLLENGDSPAFNLSDSLWQCFDYYMVHNMPLYQKLFGSYGENPEQLRAMVHLFNLVGKHRVEHLNDAPVEVRIKSWINVGLDYMKKGHVCSLMLLQRRWHEMKMCARMYFLEYWCVFRRVREKADPSEQLKRPKYLHINVAVQYPQVMLKELQNWTRTRKDGGIITMDQFDDDETYKRMKGTFMAIRKTVINIKNLVKDSPQKQIPTAPPKSELIIRPLKRINDENKKDDDDDDVVMIEDDLPIKPCDDLRGIVIENIMSSDDNNIKIVKKRKLKSEVISPEKVIDNGENFVENENVFNVETVVKSENQDDIVIEDDGPESFYEATTAEIEKKNYNTEMKENNCTENVTDENPVKIKRELDEKFDDPQAKRIKLEKIDDKNDEINENNDEVDENLDRVDEKNDAMEEPVEYDADFLKNLEREHNKLASEDEEDGENDNENETVDDVEENSTEENADIDVTIERVKIDDDVEIIEQKRETIVIEDEPESSKWNYIRKMEKSTKKLYGPLAVCKNPDFNQRLRRFTASFIIIPQNRSLLNQCKPCTIDLVNYQAIPVPKNLTAQTNAKPTGSGTMNNLPQESLSEVRVKAEKESPEKIDDSEPGKRIMPSRQSKFRSTTIPYYAPQQIPRMTSRPLQKNAPKPLPKNATKPSMPEDPQQPVHTVTVVNNELVQKRKSKEVTAMRVDSKGQPFMKNMLMKNMRHQSCAPNLRKVMTPSRPWWYQSPNTEKDFGETTLAMDTLEQILESLSEKSNKMCTKPLISVSKKNGIDNACCYMRRDILRYERRPPSKKTSKVVHLHSKENCTCCCKEVAEKLDPDNFLFLALAPSIQPSLDGLTVHMVSSNPDPPVEPGTTAPPTVAPAKTVTEQKNAVDEESVSVPSIEVHVQPDDTKKGPVTRCGGANRGESQMTGGSQIREGFQARGGSQTRGGFQTRGGSQTRGSFQTRGGSQIRGSSQMRGGSQTRGGLQIREGSQMRVVSQNTVISSPEKPQTVVFYVPRASATNSIDTFNSNETMATVSVGPSSPEPIYKFVVLNPTTETNEKLVSNIPLKNVATETPKDNLERKKKTGNRNTNLDREELDSNDDDTDSDNSELYSDDDDELFSDNDDEYIPKRKTKTREEKKSGPLKSAQAHITPPVEQTNVEGTPNELATLEENFPHITEVPVTFSEKNPEEDAKRNVLQNLLEISGISFEDSFDSDTNVPQITSTKDLHIEVSPIALNINKSVLGSKDLSPLKTLNTISVERQKMKNGQEYLVKLPRLLPISDTCDTIDLTASTTLEEENEKTTVDKPNISGNNLAPSENTEIKEKGLPKVFISSKDLMKMGLKPGVIATKILLEKGLPVTKKVHDPSIKQVSTILRNGAMVSDPPKTPSPTKTRVDTSLPRIIRQYVPKKIISQKSTVFIKILPKNQHLCPPRNETTKPDTIILLDDDEIPMVEEYLDNTLEDESSDDEILASLAKRKRLEEQNKSLKTDKKCDSDILKDPVTIDLETDESSQESEKSNEHNDETSKENDITSGQLGEKGDATSLQSLLKKPSASEISRETSVDPLQLSQESIKNTEESIKSDVFLTKQTEISTEIYSYIVMSPGSPQFDEQTDSNSHFSGKSQETVPDLDGKFQNSEKNIESNALRQSPEDFESSLPCHLIQSSESECEIPNGSIVNIPVLLE